MQTSNLKMNVICKVTTWVNAEFQFFRAAVQSYKNQESCCSSGVVDLGGQACKSRIHELTVQGDTDLLEGL